MAGRAELEARIARLEAALDATAAALRTRAAEAGTDAARDRAGADPAEAHEDRAGVDLTAARERIAVLEDALAQARGAKAARPASSGPQAGEAEALRADLAEMRAAREMDLAEMKSLLAELEPILEDADA